MQGHLRKARTENENVCQEILVCHEQISRLEKENQELKVKVDTLSKSN